MRFLLPAGRFAGYGLLALIVFACALKEPGFLGSEKASPVDMLAGTAHRPYVYRVLVPMTSHLLTSLLPSSIRQRLNCALVALIREMRGEGMYGATVARKLHAASALLVELTIAVLLMYASLVTFPYALRWLATGLCLGLNPVSLDLLGAAALLGLLPFFRYFTYLYDFPALLLFTMGLGCMARHRWWLFMTVYSVGCLNKETTILLSLVFWLYAGHRRIIASPRVALLLLSQGLIFAIIRAGLQWTFQHNPGATVEFHLLDHNLGGMPQCSLGSACGV